MLDREIEAVSMRVSATLPRASMTKMPVEIEGPASTTEVVFDGRAMSVPQLYHGSILSSEPLEGPAVVISSTTTLWLPEGARLKADEEGTLIIDPGSP
jgi:N-methylhydantoinase A/oxoprolinase/acetone carboxylase beta subunit